MHLGSLLPKLLRLDTIHKWTLAGLGAYKIKHLDQLLFLGSGGKWTKHSPGSSATGMGQFPICKLKRDLFRTSVTACTIDKNTSSAPFGIFYVRMEI